MDRKTFVLLALIICLLFTGQACCVNPQMGSLKAAYGIYGSQVNCEVPVGSQMMDAQQCMAEVFINNAPDPPFSSQSKKMIHDNYLCPVVNACNEITGTAPFYHDKSHNNDLATSPNSSAYPTESKKGKDTDKTDGIDTAMLFFHASHGNPYFCNTWSTAADPNCLNCPDNNAYTNFMKLGNCEICNRGMLRYFWQCACNVFCHGPNKSQGVVPNYPSPQDYDGSPIDTVEKRNVCVRWGHVLGDDLRMACGVSTEGWCDAHTARSIWNHYNLNYPVADAFIMGIFEKGMDINKNVIPLCIASGGPLPDNSPLIKDQHFTNLPNEEPVPRTNLYIQYPQAFASNETLDAIMPPPPTEADIFRLKVPSRLPSIDLNSYLGLSVRKDPDRGSVHFSGKLKFDPEPPKLSEAEYIDRAVKFIKYFGLTEESSDDPRGIHMMLQWFSLDCKGKAVSHAQKNVIVTFKRHIIVNGKPVTVLGDGGEIQVQMNNDGSIINASKVWREIDGVVKSIRVKTYDEAYKEAVQSLKYPEAYHLARWTWGYKELSGSVKQEEMRIVYLFYFLPKKPGPPYSPTRIEILAQSPGHDSIRTRFENKAETK